MNDEDLNKGYSSLRKGDLQGAYKSFRLICSSTKDPDKRKASLIGLSLVHRAEGNFDRAIDLTLKLCHEFPGDFIVHYDLGNLYLETGQNALAVQSYDKAIDICGPRIDFHINRGIAWFRGGNNQMALKDIKNALEMDPLNECALINAGMVHFVSGRYESAIDFFDIALEHNDRHPKALLGKGLSLYHLDMYDESMICLDAALTIDPDFHMAHYYKGKILHKLDLLDESAESIKRSISIENDHSPSYFELALVYMDMKDSDAAIGSFSSVVARGGPMTKDALVQIGRIYLYDKKSPKEALKHFKKAVKLDPEDAEIWAHSGIAFRGIEKGLDRARSALEKARSIGSDDLRSGLELSEVYLEMGEDEKAKDLLEFLTDRYQDPRSYLLKAYAEYSLGMFKDCIDSSESSLRLDQNNLQAYIIMGRCYGKLGRIEEYRQCLRKYLHSDPDNKKAIEELSSIS